MSGIAPVVPARIAERIARGHKFNWYETDDDEVVVFGIGSVTNFLILGRCSSEDAASFVVAALACAVVPA